MKTENIEIEINSLMEIDLLMEIEELKEKKRASPPHYYAP